MNILVYICPIQISKLKLIKLLRFYECKLIRNTFVIVFDIFLLKYSFLPL